ncbi:TetR family transcriptional regulator C-terminal domain-containing protein [Yokenella regensburgei]|uniref:TetR family transcriptional regulator C-terminal domain-containing protein n=1 Tax=Yokenella regensburgei TaxID=158877 RepID=UPI003F17C686
MHEGFLNDAAKSQDKGRIRQDNEAIILPAAERVFARYGFHGATMQQIADEAALPKANLHYYFGSKKHLYLRVLEGILHDWLAPLEGLSASADPKRALAEYINNKMAFSFARPDASRLFANEILQGAQVVYPLLTTQLHDLVAGKARILDTWIRRGALQPMDTTHFFFTLWSMTQTYADFDIQIAAVLGGDSRSKAAQRRATEHVFNCIWRICGFDEE